MKFLRQNLVDMGPIGVGEQRLFSVSLQDVNGLPADLEVEIYGGVAHLIDLFHIKRQGPKLATINFRLNVQRDIGPFSLDMVVESTEWHDPLHLHVVGSVVEYPPVFVVSPEFEISEMLDA